MPLSYAHGCVTFQPVVRLGGAVTTAELCACDHAAVCRAWAVLCMLMLYERGYAYCIRVCVARYDAGYRCLPVPVLCFLVRCVVLV